MAVYISRILRRYRNLPPTKFHTFNQRVTTSLMNANLPDSIWAANPTLLSSYLAVSQKHDAVYHQAIYGSKLDISEREILQEQIIIYLDEIALVLEAAALRNPEILLSSGFELAKERRNSSRTKTATTASEASTAEQQGEQH